MRISRVLYVILGSGLILLSAYGGYYFAKNSGSVLSENYLESVSAQASGMSYYLEENAVMDITYRYAFCGHAETVATSASALGMTGLGSDELDFNGITTVRTFSPSNAEVVVEVDEYCPKHLIVKSDGKGVYVYKTDSQTGENRKYLDLNIRNDQVAPAFLQDINTGVVFDSTSEVNKYVKDMRK